MYTVPIAAYTVPIAAVNHASSQRCPSVHLIAEQYAKGVHVIHLRFEAPQRSGNPLSPPSCAHSLQYYMLHRLFTDTFMTNKQGRHWAN
jgi:hypothetical protein